MVNARRKWMILFATVCLYPLRLAAPPVHFEFRLVASGGLWILTPDLCFGLGWKKSLKPPPPADYSCRRIQRENLSNQREEKELSGQIQIERIRSSSRSHVHLYLPQWRILILRYPGQREVHQLLQRRPQLERLILVSRGVFLKTKLPLRLRNRSLLLQTQNPEDELQKWGEFRFQLRSPAWKPNG